MMINTEAEMRLIMQTREPRLRLEGTPVPEGLSITQTAASNFWRFREGNQIACLHERVDGSYTSFEVSTCD